MKTDITAMSIDELKEYIDYCERQSIIQDKLQHSVKILLNSLYGAMGSAYFRFYDKWKAEGITLSGQVVLDKSYKVFNGYLSKMLKRDGDWVIASDTDSAYVDFTEFVEKHVPEGKDKVEFLNQFCDKVLKVELDKGMDELASRMNAMKNQMNMKREAIGSAVFVAKKNYVMLVFDNEGVRYSTPKLKITGLEAIKSSTPEFFRNHLKDVYMHAFNGTESSYRQNVQKVRDEFAALSVGSISAASSVSDVLKYTMPDGSFGPNTPYQAKAAIVYNKYVKDNKLEEKYTLISNGDKIKIVKLVIPNPLGVKAVAYLDRVPEEMNLDRWVDRKAQIEKFFIVPSDRVFNLIGWHYEEKHSVDELFY